MKQVNQIHYLPAYYHNDNIKECCSRIIREEAIDCLKDFLVALLVAAYNFLSRFIR